MKPATETTAAGEEWRPVKGYEGIYEVSNFGRVRSLDRMVNYISKYGKHYQVLTRGKIIAPKPNFGYYLIHLSHQGAAVHKQIHRLVAEAFIPNPNNLPEVNHKDENGMNNRADNLEWCTTMYNINYGTAIERRAEKKRKPIRKYTKDGTLVQTFPSVTAASKSLGKGRKGTGLISTCANGKRPFAYKYRWEFV
jgi:hypothetical protein